MLVIGNGESRKGINIDSLDYPKIGCNAILRDASVDHLVCCDRRMVQEAISSNYNAKVYTRKDWISYFSKYPHIKTVPDLPYKGNQRPDDPFHWGSGPYAVLLGAKKCNGHCHLLGFDLYSVDKKVNNIYKNTNNYAKTESRSVDPRYWIYQIGKIFQCFPKINFIVHAENDWTIPESWNRSNVMVDTISNI